MAASSALNVGGGGLRRFLFFFRFCIFAFFHNYSESVPPPGANFLYVYSHYPITIPFFSLSHFSFPLSLFQSHFLHIIPTLFFFFAC